MIVGGPVSTVRTSILAPATRAARARLQRAHQAIGVLASGELQQELRVVRGRRFRTHRKPEPWSARSDERGDGRERRFVAVSAIVVAGDFTDDLIRFTGNVRGLRERRVLGQTNVHVREIEVVSRKELAVKLAHEECTGR